MQAMPPKGHTRESWQRITEAVHSLPSLGAKVTGVTPQNRVLWLLHCSVLPVTPKKADLKVYDALERKGQVRYIWPNAHEPGGYVITHEGEKRLGYEPEPCQRRLTVADLGPDYAFPKDIRGRILIEATIRHPGTMETYITIAQKMVRLPNAAIRGAMKDAL